MSVDVFLFKILTVSHSLDFEQLTGNIGELDLGRLGSASDQLDLDGAISVLGGSSPSDGERSAGLDGLARLGSVDGIEVGSLRKGSGGESQNSGDGETHVGGLRIYTRTVVYKVVDVEPEGMLLSR